MNSDARSPVPQALKHFISVALSRGWIPLSLLLSITLIGCSISPRLNEKTATQLDVSPIKSTASCVETTEDAARIRARKESLPLSFYDARVPYPKRLSDSIKWFLIEPPSGPPSPESIVEAELTIQPNGDISSWRIKKASGSPDWDSAITRALKKAEKVPLDANCNAPPSRLVITFKP